MSNIYFPHILLYNKNDKKEKLNKKRKNKRRKSETFITGNYQNIAGNYNCGES